MPVYEYACDACNRQFDAWQKITEPPVDRCPSCQTTGKVRRLISRSSFSLKGSGWYVTDYKRKASAGGE